MDSKHRVELEQLVLFKNLTALLQRKPIESFVPPGDPIPSPPPQKTDNIYISHTTFYRNPIGVFSRYPAQKQTNKDNPSQQRRHR